MGDPHSRPDVGDPGWRLQRADRRRAVIRWFFAWAFALLAIGASIGALSLLRWAHLYRQKHYESLGFAWVAMLLAGSWCSALFAAGLLVREAFVPYDRTRRWLVVAAACIVLLVMSATVASLWVEGHGDRCVGRC